MIYHKLKNILKKNLIKNKKFDKEKENELKNNLCKLINYLNIIFDSIEINDYYLNNNLFNYDNIEFIYNLSIYFNPNLFIGNLFYPNNLIKNRIYLIKLNSNENSINSLLTIEKSSFKINQIILFKTIWLEEFYFQPMNFIKSYFKN